MDNFREEILGCGVSCFISKEHTFGTDALLLADFAAPLRKDRCCDLGTGCGIIPLLWCRGEIYNTVYAVEIAKQACDQMKKSIVSSHLDKKINIINGDIRNIKNLLPHAEFDLVTMNPPYKAGGTGILSSSAADIIARHESECNLDDVCAAASHLLRFGGRFCICQRPERLCDVIESMKKHSIEPKRLRLVCKNSSSVPWLFLLEGKKGSKSHLTIQKNFFVENDNGGYTDEMKEIYRLYEKSRGEDK